jgi:hypothetical protein
MSIRQTPAIRSVASLEMMPSAPCTVESAASTWD